MKSCRALPLAEAVAFRRGSAHDQHPACKNAPVFLGNYAESSPPPPRVLPKNGMAPGGGSFPESLHSVQAANEYFFAAGDGPGAFR